MKLLTTLIILFVISPSAAYSWQWRITERANCTNGQCSNPPAKTLTPSVPLKNAGVDFNATIQESLIVQYIPTYNEKLVQPAISCPDGRCPLVKRTNPVPGQPRLVPQPTLAPPEPIVINRPIMQSVMRPVQRIAMPVKRIIGFRLFRRWGCR